jgi:RimJ/RimL family protein N-acetyltransferase
MSGRHVGYLSLDRFGERLDMAEVGWVLHPEAHVRGVATEAARELVRFGFDELGLHRVEARTDPRNDRSIAVCRRLGMQREGQLRHVVCVGEERRDELVFATLVEEWRTA